MNTNPPKQREQAESPACQQLCPAHTDALGHFFERLRAHEIDKFFHPHPLTREEAPKRAAYGGADFYCVLVQATDIIGYGMLRGWDEGYEVPSLGIVIDPSSQGRGYGRLLMEFLHATARQRGARRIRLKVYADNLKAVSLYRSLGYDFQGEERGQLVGYLELTPAAGVPQKQNRE